MEPVRLETTLGGRMVGEIGFFLNLPRSAAVVASTDASVYRLPRAALAQMQAADMEALAALYQLSIHTLSHRVLHLTRSLEAALR
jgi:SulP family sulfate permease